MNIACQTISRKTKKRICPSVTCNPSIRETIRSGGREIDETLAIANEAKTAKTSNSFKMYLNKNRLLGIMSGCQQEKLLGVAMTWDLLVSKWVTHLSGY
jgi:hypothetical protein